MNAPNRHPEESDGTIPLYLVTEGRSRPDVALALDVVTLVVTKSAPRTDMQPEHDAIVRMCRNPLSVAEISAYLNLPFSVVSVLLADLLTHGQVEAREVRSTVPPAMKSDIDILRALIDGLQKL